MTNCVADEDKTKMYPIGVFWDIENCCVPTGKSAAAIAEKIRQTFFRGMCCSFVLTFIYSLPTFRISTRRFFLGSNVAFV